MPASIQVDGAPARSENSVRSVFGMSHRFSSAMFPPVPGCFLSLFYPSPLGWVKGRIKMDLFLEVLLAFLTIRRKI